MRSGETVQRDVVIAAADGYELAATLYEAPGADTTVLVNSATAVPRRFYRRFAHYLQRHGWQVLTYDYRGIGGSKPPSLRGFDATMRDWTFLDMTAAVDWIAREPAPRRLFAVGHSFGGPTFGLVENASHVDAMVGVSAQSGHWGVQGGQEPVRVRLIVTLIIPLLSRCSAISPGAGLRAARTCRKGARVGAVVPQWQLPA